ncbi:MAG: RHS repeat-associated core domain-containing protein [Planctomycetota bacterium]|nr:RHS repeat-associated core domain-containing protein [Planctomycetota bacterium]
MDDCGDMSVDGQVDFDDYLDFIAAWDGGAGEEGGAIGSGQLSRASVGNRIGYAGYQFDPSIAGASSGGGAGKYHVRHRVYDAGMGRWTRRDPLGYVDGASAYEYVGGRVVVGRDPVGLDMVMNSGGSWPVDNVRPEPAPPPVPQLHQLHR